MRVNPIIYELWSIVNSNSCLCWSAKLSSFRYLSVHIYKMQSCIKYSLPIQYTDWENDRDGNYYRKIYSEMLGGIFWHLIINNVIFKLII